MPADERSRRGRLASAALWGLLVTAIVVWAIALWHPWIDWFGRPR